MDYLKKSRIEEVLIAILGKGMVTSRLLSRIEKILDAIRVKGSYDGITMSEVEEILVCILLGKRFEKPTHSRIAAMLKVKANGGEYTELRKSRVEDLIFEWINAVESAAYSGTLPATLTGTKAGYLESYKIYGNTEQAGTPTPENPIEPSGCGVRTENLYNWGTDIQYKFITASGAIISQGASSANYISEKIPVVAGKTYQLIRPITVSGTGLYAVFYDENDAALSAMALSLNSSYTLEAPTGASYFRTSLKRNDAENDISMFTEGSTTFPYEPYGYKLPLTVNSVEYPIYLGDAQLAKDEYVSYPEQKIYRRTLFIAHDNKHFITKDNKDFCLRRESYNG